MFSFAQKEWLPGLGRLNEQKYFEQSILWRRVLKINHHQKLNNYMPMHLAKADVTGTWVIAMFNNRLGICFSINRRLNR
jgi:hypothetical protein